MYVINEVDAAQVTAAFSTYAEDYFDRPRALAMRDPLFARRWLVKYCPRLYTSNGEEIASHQLRSARSGTYTKSQVVDMDDDSSSDEEETDSDREFIANESEDDSDDSSSDSESEAEFTDDDMEL
jgi:hypothetical protein